MGMIAIRVKWEKQIRHEFVYKYIGDFRKGYSSMQHRLYSTEHTYMHVHSNMRLQ